MISKDIACKYDLGVVFFTWINQIVDSATSLKACVK